MRTVTLSLLLIVSAIPAAAQNVIPPPPRPTVASLAGPRFGITVLPDGVVSKLRSATSTCGRRFPSSAGSSRSSSTRKTAASPCSTNGSSLVGGLDQGVALPSLSWMVGMRTANGTEFGVGPNVSPSGVALAIAAGTTLRAGFLNVPVNFAVVPSRSGIRISFLTGFSVRK